MIEFLKRMNSSRQRRGVGAIIGGVILAAILLTTVMVYFITILNNEKAKTSYEMLAAQATQDKADEDFTVPRARDIIEAPDGLLRIEIQITNDGALPLVVSKILLYCTSDAGCASDDPIEDAADRPLPMSLNAAEMVPVHVGPVSDTLSYRIEVITERGNIVAAKECLVNEDDLICENDNAGEEEEEPPCLTCAVNEGIIQGTGSLQLDFKSFGALFPDLGSRRGVDQRGWDVVISSPYGSATGYPAFDIPAGLNTVIVERVRNLDPSGNDLVINRNTGLVVNVGKTTSGQPDPNYVCYADKDAKTLTAYDDNNPSASVTVDHTEIDAELDEGWHELFFCSSTPKTAYGSNPWVPDAKFNNINGLFMVARGTFAGTQSEYAQTIPYQAIQVGKSSGGGGSITPNLVACLRNQDTGVACPAPKTNDDSTTSLIYQATSSQMRDGQVPGTPTGTVHLHVNTVTTNPYDVSWIYPDGVFKRLTPLSGATITTPSTQNIPILIPTGDSDDSDGSVSDIDSYCGSAYAKNDAVYFTIMITDDYDASSFKNAYYITWKMACS